MIAIATTAWNCRDIIEQFLDYHLAASVRRVFVLDFGSDDGTLELLQPYVAQGTVEVFQLPSLAGKDWENLLLKRVNECAGAFEWCLFIDPDEFVSDPHGLDHELGQVPDEIAIATLARFNVTGHPPDSLQYSPKPFVDQYLKIKKRKQRTAEEKRRGDLDPPWIFTDVPGKIALRIPLNTVITRGCHSAEGDTGYTLAGVELLHFPVRSWAKFDEKIRLAEIDLDSNPHLPPGHAWHWRRWIAIRKRGDLVSEYLSQFIAAQDLASLVRDDVVEVIGSVAPEAPMRAQG